MIVTMYIHKNLLGKTFLQTDFVLLFLENKNINGSEVRQILICITSYCFPNLFIFYCNVQRQDGRKQSEGTHKSIEAVVARLEKQNGMSLSHTSSPEEAFMETSEGMNNMDDAVVPRILYEELLRSYQQQQEEMRHIQQELERTRRQLVQQAKKLKEYGALVSEMKELRDLNRRLQDVLLLRLGSGKCRT